MQKNNIKNDNFLLDKQRKEFLSFYISFIGYLIHRGRKGTAINNFDYIIFQLKKHYKYQNVISVLFKFFLQLYPIFSIKYRRLGKNYQPIPKLAFGNIKNVLIFSWFLKSLKGKSNVYGIKLDDIVKIIIDTVDNNRSSALLNKTFFYKRALSGKHFLRNVRKRRKSRRRKS